MAILKSRLAPPTRIVVYLRERTAYLRSYAEQLRRMGISRETKDKDSFAYMEPDTWLIDYDRRLDPFVRAFGKENVCVINYDTEVAENGSVIPSFLDAIGAKSHFSKDDWWGLMLNRTPL
jgi:hypothetical protein